MLYSRQADADGRQALNLTLPTLCTFAVAAGFLALERLVPGRELPHSRGWYARALLINLTQVGITFSTNAVWVDLFSRASAFHLAKLEAPILEGFIGWFVG